MSDFDVCWLALKNLDRRLFPKFFLNFSGKIATTLRDEISTNFDSTENLLNEDECNLFLLLLDTNNQPSEIGDEGYRLSIHSQKLTISANSEIGVLYGFYRLLRLMSEQAFSLNEDRVITSKPDQAIRMLNHWDNGDGSVERGYAGKSLFFNDYEFIQDRTRLKHYARLLASIGINAVAINNVNVHFLESFFISMPYLKRVSEISHLLSYYGIKLYLSINYAAPIEFGDLDTADPRLESVKNWWKVKTANIYKHVPEFGGFLVKADSENRPGPFTYGATHVDGANMLADALLPFDGKVMWRCFVYNCKQDWRDRSIDRACAAYDHFMPYDGQFAENVILQIKNGPMDFQIREAVSPLIGGLSKTNQLLEFQLAQEYTGQQKHICYLIPMYKEVLDTVIRYSNGNAVKVQDAIKQSCMNTKNSGIVAVTNLGDDWNWTGHSFAQANLFGLGLLMWDNQLSSEAILQDWLNMTYDYDEAVYRVIKSIQLTSRETYENYTTPLGIGWMVKPNHHYGVSVDGYEYDKWGTYHFADHQGLGVNRTRSGSGYTSQYQAPIADLYENLESCPDNLLLFFHHVDYTYKLKNGKTVIQYLYDSHFEGVATVERYIADWEGIKHLIPEPLYQHVAMRFTEQLASAIEWRDQVNTYFYRKSYIADEQNRKIYR